MLESGFSHGLARRGGHKSLKSLRGVSEKFKAAEKLNETVKRLGLNDPLNFAKREIRRTRQGADLREFSKLNSVRLFSGGGL
jgi:hypothetical protein